MYEALSFTNQNVQRLRRLIGRRSARSDAGVWVVEGAVLIAEALASGWTVETEFVAPSGEPVTDARCFGLADGVIERVATTERPQPNIAIVRPPQRDTSLHDAGLVIVCDRLNDPGNLGTIIRSAEAAGADAVVLTKGSVDPSNPKVIRSSAGAVFHVPVIAAEFADVTAAGVTLVGTSSHLGDRHTAADWSGRIGVVLGNEAHGLPDDAPVARWVRIEHQGRAESLNVAMAATLVIFEAARQRSEI